MKFFQILIAFLLAVVVLTDQTVLADEKDEGNESFAKEDKLLIANLGGFAILTTWGIMSWDYGERSSHTRSEGWFEQDTTEGGADKAAHFYASYLTSHGIAALCESWGYSIQKSSLYGALSSFGLMSFIEIGDSFSHYGLSFEDFFMNTLGCYAGYLLYRYPEYGRKIDFRVEYLPDFSADDMSTDYENMKFLMAVKLDGFDAVENRYLQFLEYHIGYYARGYSDDNKEKKRHFYMGIGINLSKVFSDLSFRKTAKVFNYYQVPFTYAPLAWELPE
ncbi:MAG: DUF2279 domain-containing protein [Pseudomonadota bacterium]